MTNEIYKKSDDPKLIRAIIAVSAVAVLVFLAGAILVGQMVLEFGFTSSSAGYVISIELAGMAVAAFLGNYWLYSVNLKQAVRTGLLLAALANGITVIALLSWQVNLNTLLLLRFLTGLPCGALMVICIKTIAQLNNVDRGYALHTLGQLVGYSAAAALLPNLFIYTGLYIAYALFGLSMIATIPMSRHFPAAIIRAKQDEVNSRGTNWLGLLSLLGILFFYISLTGVWTYVERIGVRSGFASTTIGYVLSITALLGILGAGFAAWSAGKVSSLLMIIIGLSLMSFSVWMFLGPQTLINYIIAASIAKLTWTFVLPFMLGTVALIDYSGRLTTNVFTVIAAGIAAGPAIAATLIGVEANYDRSVLFSVWIIIACLLSLTFVAYKAKTLRIKA